MIDAAAILHSCRFFAGVSGASFQRLLDMAQGRQYAAGTFIFREGEKCPGVFIVGAGLVRVFKTSPGGREHVLHLVGPGGQFAEVAAIGDFPCPAFAQALEETVCVLLPTEPFTRVLREDHQLCLQLLASMSGWVRHLVGLLEDIALRDAIGRVARYLSGVMAGDGVVRLPSLKKHLASHLNLTSETLSRTLRRLTDMEIIAAEDEQIVVRERAKLMELATGESPLV